MLGEMAKIASRRAKAPIMENVLDKTDAAYLSGFQETDAARETMKTELRAAREKYDLPPSGVLG
jgi:hypothetical protein